MDWYWVTGLPEPKFLRIFRFKVCPQWERTNKPLSV